MTETSVVWFSDSIAWKTLDTHFKPCNAYFLLGASTGVGQVLLDNIFSSKSILLNLKLRLSSIRKMNFRVKVNSKVTFHLTMTVPKQVSTIMKTLTAYWLKKCDTTSKNSFRNNNKQHCY